jgi:hypothetical protein
VSPPLYEVGLFLLTLSDPPAVPILCTFIRLQPTLIPELISLISSSLHKTLRVCECPLSFAPLDGETPLL